MKLNHSVVVDTLLQTVSHMSKDPSLTVMVDIDEGVASVVDKVVEEPEIDVPVSIQDESEQLVVVDPLLRPVSQMDIDSLNIIKSSLLDVKNVLDESRAQFNTLCVAKFKENRDLVLKNKVILTLLNIDVDDILQDLNADMK